MDRVSKEKKHHKGGLITKTWERCKSIGRGGNNSPSDTHLRLTKKSKSWNGNEGHAFPESRKYVDTLGNGILKSKHKGQTVPEGCFSVYVGPDKQRFVIKTECVNHPLFRMLLEEAETEYGYCTPGPLELPCSVDVFFRVLSEMESDKSVRGARRVYGFPRGGGARHGSYQMLSPHRQMIMATS